VTRSSTRPLDEHTCHTEDAVRVLPSLTLIVFATMPTTIAAQGSSAPVPAFETSGGYQVLVPDDEGETEVLERGWFVDGAVNLNRVVGFVAHAGGNYERETANFANQGVTFDIDGRLRLHEIMGGVRFNDRRHVRLLWFGQILGGLVRASGKATGTITGPNLPTEIETVELVDNNAGLQLGGGVRFGLTSRIGVVGAIDSLYIFA
jgi:hypothetical protein